MRIEISRRSGYGDSVKCYCRVCIRSNSDKVLCHILRLCYEEYVVYCDRKSYIAVRQKYT